MEERVAYILGAGCSAVAGLPVMSNFISRAKDIYFSSQDTYQYFHKIFRRINEISKVKNYFNSDLFNIEKLFSIFDMESALSSRGRGLRFDEFIMDVVDYYSYSISDITRSYPGNWYSFIFGSDHAHQYIGFFAASLFHIKIEELVSAHTREESFLASSMMQRSSTKYSVISLNYDTLLETSISSLNDGYQSEFSFSKDDYIKDWTNPMLFKLHGDLEKQSIIPPTWSKSIQPSMRKTWINAFKLLENCTQIRFLGYSMPISDSYFKYFLKSSIMNNPHLKNIDVICLDENLSVETNYNSVFDYRDFRFKNGDLHKYFGALINENRERRRIHHHKAEEFCQLEKIHNEFMST